jgi:hypothetical protein
MLLLLVVPWLPAAVLAALLLLLPLQRHPSLVLAVMYRDHTQTYVDGRLAVQRPRIDCFTSLPTSAVLCRCS